MGKTLGTNTQERIHKYHTLENILKKVYITAKTCTSVELFITKQCHLNTAYVESKQIDWIFKCVVGILGITQYMH